MKIEKLDLKKLRNEEHFQFQSDFKTLVDEFTVAALNIEDVYLHYPTYYNDESLALDFIRKSSITDDLIDSDNLRDESIRGFYDTVKGYSKHFNPAFQIASVRILVVLDHYSNIATKPYDEETAAINSLIGDLLGSTAADINTLGLADWVNDLKFKNDNFTNLMKTRYSEGAGKTQLRMKEVRMQVDDTYRTIVERINALIIVEGNRNIIRFATELNQRISKYSVQLAQRKGRNAKEPETIETKTV